MEKSELVAWLQEEQAQWQAFLDEIGPERMDEPGVCGQWSVKDFVGHMSGWQRRLLAHMEAAQRGEPEPAPPWPAHLEDEDDINAWIYESNRGRTVAEVLEDSENVLQAYQAFIEGLPEDVQIEAPWRVVTLGDTRFPAGEFFDHFHDDHEAEIRAWMARD